MKELKVAGFTPPAFKVTTIPDALLEDSPNLVKDAALCGINQIWVSDITYVATKSGWLYLCIIIDLFSRKVELIRGTIFADHEQAEAAIFEYVEVYYNRLRLHSALDYKAPEEFEMYIAN